MRKPKPKVLREKPRTYRKKGLTVKTHKTKASAEKHAKKQMGEGKVSIVAKKQPYVTFTAKGSKPKAKPKKKARKRRR